MDKQVIEIGGKVQVINQRLDGTSFIEGYAVVIGQDGRDYHYCSVRFYDDESPVYRWIRDEIVK